MPSTRTWTTRNPKPRIQPWSFWPPSTSPGPEDTPLSSRSRAPSRRLITTVRHQYRRTLMPLGANHAQWSNRPAPPAPPRSPNLQTRAPTRGFYGRNQPSRAACWCWAAVRPQSPSTARTECDPEAPFCSSAAPVAAAPALGSPSCRHSPPRSPRCQPGLALELAPVQVNLIAPAFVDTPLSASLRGDHLEERRNQLRATLPYQAGRRTG